MIESQEGSWRAMLGDLGIAPLALWHEDVLADSAAAVARVAGYVGIDIDPAAAEKVPPVERQSQRGARDWAARHAANG
jgi:LPS sulfotransferase NodH